LRDGSPKSDVAKVKKLQSGIRLAIGSLQAGLARGHQEAAGIVESRATTKTKKKGFASRE
jgi:hypothetical protein